jgi:serine-threonine kinase receptor-associated protein
VRYAPGGESYTSGSEDGTVRIWVVGSVNHPEESNLSGHVKLVAEEVVRKAESLRISEKAAEAK